MVKEITPIRVLLMLMIFIHHINTSYNGGYPAVAGFFLLGGFVMTLGYYAKVDASDFSYSSFVAKRVVRIYPMHWLCIALILLMGIFAGTPIGASGKVILLNAFLLQSLIPDMDVYFSLNSVSWYCSALFFFVLLFPLFLRFVKGISSKSIAAFYGIMVGVYLVLWFLTPSVWRHPILYINPVVRLVDSLVGVGVAMFVIKISKEEVWMSCFNRHKGLLQWLVVLCLCVFVALSIFLPGKWKSLALLYWLPMIMALVGMTMLNYLKVPNALSRICLSFPLQWLGRCAFSFYMIHALVIRYLREWIETSIPYGHNVYVCASVLFIIAIAIAQVCYYLIEVKLTNKLNSVIIKIS